MRSRQSRPVRDILRTQNIEFCFLCGGYEFNGVWNSEGHVAINTQWEMRADGVTVFLEKGNIFEQAFDLCQLLLLEFSLSICI